MTSVVRVPLTAKTLVATPEWAVLRIPKPCVAGSIPAGGTSRLTSMTTRPLDDIIPSGRVVTACGWRR